MQSSIMFLRDHAFVDHRISIKKCMNVDKHLETKILDLDLQEVLLWDNDLSKIKPDRFRFSKLHRLDPSPSLAPKKRNEEKVIFDFCNSYVINMSHVHVSMVLGVWILARVLANSN